MKVRAMTVVNGELVVATEGTPNRFFVLTTTAEGKGWKELPRLVPSDTRNLSDAPDGGRRESQQEYFGRPRPYRGGCGA